MAHNEKETALSGLRYPWRVPETPDHFFCASYPKPTIKEHIMKRITIPDVIVPKHFEMDPKNDSKA